MVKNNFFKFANLFILLFANNALPQDNGESRFERSCGKRIPSQSINIISGSTEFLIDNSKDIADISQISRGNNLSSVSMGLTVATSSIDITSNTLFFKPHPNTICGKIGFNGSIYLSQHVIYIAKEYPQDSCEYKKILEHEKLHAKINQENIQNNVSELREYLKSKYSDKVLFSSGDKIETKSILEDASKFSKSHWELNSKKQAQVDKSMTWEDILSTCKNKK